MSQSVLGNGGSSGFHGEQGPVPFTIPTDLQSGSNQCAYNRYTCIWQGLVISSQKWNKFSLHDLFECLTPLLFRHNGYFQPWLFRIWTLSLINWRGIQSSFLSNIARVVLTSVPLSVKRYQQTSTIDVASAQRSFSWTIFFSHASATMKLRKLDLIFWCVSFTSVNNKTFSSLLCSGRKYNPPTWS